MTTSERRYLLSAAFRIIADDRERAFAALRRVQDGARAAAGCHQYDFAVALDDLNVVRLFEVWGSEADVRRHLPTVPSDLIAEVQATVEPIGDVIFYDAPAGRVFDFGA